MLLLSMPPLLTSLVLVFLAARTGWLPVGGMSSVDAGRRHAGIFCRHMVVPVLALALPLSAMFERLQAQAMGDTIGQPFVLATLARGVPPARIVWRDALKPALRPVVSVYGLVVGTLLSGSFAVEIITSWPGLGQLMLNALAPARHLPGRRLRGDRIDLPGGRHVPVRRRARRRRSEDNGMSGREEGTARGRPPDARRSGARRARRAVARAARSEHAVRRIS